MQVHIYVDNLASNNSVLTRKDGFCLVAYVEAVGQDRRLQPLQQIRPLLSTPFKVALVYP